MISLTIDGKKIEVTEGTTVLEAARQAQVFVPTLCDHPELTPYGGCRLCLVQVEGMRGLQPSCTLPASNNMVITTDNDQIRAARRFVLTLISASATTSARTARFPAATANCRTPRTTRA
jgi:NADH dehydrogenase/NADH:ubiquinone oxidoreductase subunit G